MSAISTPHAGVEGVRNDSRRLSGSRSSLRAPAPSTATPDLPAGAMPQDRPRRALASTSLLSSSSQHSSSKAVSTLPIAVSSFSSEVICRSASQALMAALSGISSSNTRTGLRHCNNNSRDKQVALTTRPHNCFRLSLRLAETLAGPPQRRAAIVRVQRGGSWGLLLATLSCCCCCRCRRCCC